MNNLLKNKSILIDSEHHQKARRNSERYHLPIKKYVEDLIHYADKNGINPKVLTKDPIVEKLDSIQKMMETTCQRTSDLARQFELGLTEQAGSISEIRNNTKQLKGGLDNTIAVRVEELEKIKGEYRDFIKKLYMDQLHFYNSVLAAHPNFFKGQTGSLGKSYETVIGDLLKSFKESIKIKNQLFPKKS